MALFVNLEEKKGEEWEEKIGGGVDLITACDGAYLEGEAEGVVAASKEMIEERERRWRLEEKKGEEWEKEIGGGVDLITACDGVYSEGEAKGVATTNKRRMEERERRWRLEEKKGEKEIDDGVDLITACDRVNLEGEVEGVAVSYKGVTTRSNEGGEWCWGR